VWSNVSRAGRGILVALILAIAALAPSTASASTTKRPDTVARGFDVGEKHGDGSRR
jgi:hypothetical protein